MSEEVIACEACARGYCLEHGVDNRHIEKEEAHEESETRGELIKIILAGILFASSFFVPVLWVKSAILGVAYLIVGAEVIISAVRELIHEHSIDEEFLMTIATVGAMAIGELTEAVAVMLFYSVGELLEDIACDRSRKSITALLELRPDRISLKRDGRITEYPLEEAAAGDIAVFSAGERISLDGVILSGSTEVDNSALTGESLPIPCGVGDPVYGGGINLSGTVEVRVTKPYAESSAARILELVENAQEKKAKTERFITRFARKYTVAVVLLAIFIAFVCPIFTGYAATFTSWFYRGLTLLVVSCPCAFVISVPLSFFAGIGCASRNGILFKGTSSIETVARLDAIAFDKTGTLTKGELSVSGVDGDPDALRLAAHAESLSSHPIAKAIVKAYGKEPVASLVSDIREEAGRGVTANVGGDEIFVGRGENGVEVRKNGNYIATIHLSDQIKEGAPAAISSLKELGTKRLAVISGDSESAVKSTAEAAGIEESSARLTPEGKCDALSELKKSGRTAFVGDGINDAPVLAMADVGIAMGGLGSDAAIETADVVILDDSLARLPMAVKISRRTMSIVYQCMAFAFAAKLAVIVLELFGLAGMWAAVFADVGVTVLCILNALRALNYKAK